MRITVFLFSTVVVGFFIGLAAASFIFTEDEIPSDLVGALYGACLSTDQAVTDGMMQIDQANITLTGVDAHLKRFGPFRARAFEMAGISTLSVDSCQRVISTMEQAD